MEVLYNFFNRLVKEQSRVNSVSIMNIVVQMAKLFILFGHTEKAKEILKFFLFSDFKSFNSDLKTNFRNILSKDFDLNSQKNYSYHGDFPLKKFDQLYMFSFLELSEYSCIWLIYVHLVLFNDIPEQIFFDYPHNYLVKNNFNFALNFSMLEKNSETEFRIGEASFLICYLERNFRNLPISQVTECKDAQHNVLKIFKNFKFLKIFNGEFSNDSQKLEKFYLKSNIFNNNSFKVEFNTISNFDNGYKKILENNFKEKVDFGYWNRCAKFFYDAGDFKGMMLSLINCARSCFEGLPLIEEFPVNITPAVNETCQLYEELLDLIDYKDTENDLVYTNPLNKPVISKNFVNQKLKSNFFLWMNYYCLNCLIFKVETIKETNVDGMDIDDIEHVDMKKPKNLKLLFKAGLKNLNKADDSSFLLWNECLKYKSFKNNFLKETKSFLELRKISKDLILDLNLALMEINKPVEFQLIKENIYRGDSFYGEVVPLKYSYFSTKLLDTVLPNLTKDKLFDLIQVLLKLYPDSLYSEIAVANIFFLSDDEKKKKKNYSFFFGKKCLLNCLKINPSLKIFWKILIYIEAYGPPLGSKARAKSIFNEYIKYFPFNDIDMDWKSGEDGKVCPEKG
ncbi:hypothetical protein HDU92_003426 [Lobulomyces angularis]|nr:hypothetical protein HDU92_003426 [Lobulomyces angularis]